VPRREFAVYLGESLGTVWEALVHVGVVLNGNEVVPRPRARYAADKELQWSAVRHGRRWMNLRQAARITESRAARSPSGELPSSPVRNARMPTTDSMQCRGLRARKGCREPAVFQEPDHTANERHLGLGPEFDHFVSARTRPFLMAASMAWHRGGITPERVNAAVDAQPEHLGS